MKKLISAISTFAVLQLLAITGPEAAALITSWPDETYYATPDTFEMIWTYYDSGDFVQTEIAFSTDDWETALQDVVSGLKSTVNSLALNAAEALAKTAVLSEIDLFLSARISTLEATTRNAISQLTTVKTEDSHGNRRESDVETGDKDLTLKGLDVPVDGLSIDYTGAPIDEKTPKPIEVRGFSQNMNGPQRIPHPKDGKLEWDSVVNLADSRSLEMNNDPTSAFTYSMQLKGWDNGGVGLCGETVSDMLRGSGDYANHYALTYYKGNLHYTQIGSPLGQTMVADGKSIVTNSSGTLSIAHLPAVSGQLLLASGNGDVSWENPPPTVGYDADDGVVTIIPGGDDDAPEQSIVLPMIWVEDDEGAQRLHYRNLDSDEEGVVDIPSSAPSNMCDEVTVTKNADGDIEIKGYSSELGNSKYLGTGSNGEWGVHDLPSVTTNSVEGDNVTITSDTHDGVKTLGFADWPSGGGLLAVASDGGRLRYIPFPEPGITNCVATSVDGVSISSNSTGKIEIKGFSSGENPCTKDIAELLTADADDQYDHQFLARAGSGEKTLHYVAMGRVPHPDASQFSVDGTTKRFVLKTQTGKVLKGVANNGIEWADLPSADPDGNSIVLNGENKLALAGLDGGNVGKYLRQVSGGVEWTDLPSTNVVTNATDSAFAPDNCSVVTNAPGHAGEAAISGFWNSGTSNGMVPTKSGSSISWTRFEKFSGAFSYFDGRIHDGCVVVGRRPYKVTGVAATNGDFRVKIILGASPSISVESGDGFTAPSGDTSYIPLFKLQNGAISEDYRGCFVVPAWE